MLLDWYFLTPKPVSNSRNDSPHTLVGRSGQGPPPAATSNTALRTNRKNYILTQSRTLKLPCNHVSNNKTITL